jgi:glycosyltransferase involved in cell wall biosynthesis
VPEPGTCRLAALRVTLDGSVLGWGPGGIARYLRNLLHWMVQDPELQFEVLANSRTPVADVPGVTEIDRRLKGGPLWRAAVLSPHLLSHRPDVFWVPGLNPPLVLPHPYAITVHDLAPAFLSSVKPRLETLAFRTIYRRAVTGATHVLADSETTASDLQRHWSIPAERITVVPLGVSERFSPDESGAARRRVIDRWGLTRPYVLLAGTIEVRKGLDLAVEIAKAIRPELVVVFCGRFGYGHQSIVSEGETAGACFLGVVSDQELVDLYRSAEVLLVPSVYEGFGLTALEAMACGTPAIVAGSAGSLESLYSGGAIVVGERKVTAWTRAIEEVTGDRSRWSDAGLALAADYTWQRSAARTAEVLKAAAQHG